MEVFLIRRLDPILSGCGGTTKLSRGATPAALWLHESQPNSNHPVSQCGCDFHTVRGGIDAEISLLVLGLLENFMEGVLIQRWELILPGCGGILTLPRAATIAARRPLESQLISNHPVGLWFPHRAGRYRPEGYVFPSPGCWSYRDLEEF